MMVSPYVVAYAACMGLLMHNRVFALTDIDGTPRSHRRVRALFSVLYLTPLCLIYFVLVDMLYLVRAVIFDTLALLVICLSCGRLRVPDCVLSPVSRLLSYTLGLTKMEIEGYRRLRTLSQLIFESFPQIFLQMHVVLAYRGRYMRETGITLHEIAASIAFAFFHLAVSLWVLWAEARTTRTSILHYAMICLSGLFAPVDRPSPVHPT